MTDIVERLRARKAFGLIGGRWHMMPSNDTECAEAAAEIERLRSIIASIVATAGGIVEGISDR